MDELKEKFSNTINMSKTRIMRFQKKQNNDYNEKAEKTGHRYKNKHVRRYYEENGIFYLTSKFLKMVR